MDVSNLQINVAAEGDSGPILSDTPFTAGMKSAEDQPAVKGENPTPIKKTVEVGWVDGDRPMVRLLIGGVVPVLLPPKQARMFAEAVRQMSHFAESKTTAKRDRQRTKRQKRKANKRPSLKEVLAAAREKREAD